MGCAPLESEPRCGVWRLAYKPAMVAPTGERKQQIVARGKEGDTRGSPLICCIHALLGQNSGNCWVAPGMYCALGDQPCLAPGGGGAGRLGFDVDDARNGYRPAGEDFSGSGYVSVVDRPGVLLPSTLTRA